MKYRKLKQWKYQLTEQFETQLGFLPFKNYETEFIIFRMDGKLILKKYYAWDGASGPCPDVRQVMIGSLVHDALYQLIRLELLPRYNRKFADLELKKFCFRAGMNRCLAELIYWGVRVFARKGARPRPITPICEIKEERHYEK